MADFVKNREKITKIVEISVFEDIFAIGPHLVAQIFFRASPNSTYKSLMEPRISLDHAKSVGFLGHSVICSYHGPF